MKRVLDILIIGVPTAVAAGAMAVGVAILAFVVWYGWMLADHARTYSHAKAFVSFTVETERRDEFLSTFDRSSTAQGFVLNARKATQGQPGIDYLYRPYEHPDGLVLWLKEEARADRILATLFDTREAGGWRPIRDKMIDDLKAFNATCRDGNLDAC